MKIGERLRDARVACGLTQESAAEKINVSRQTISNWETERTYSDIIRSRRTQVLRLLILIDILYSMWHTFIRRVKYEENSVIYRYESGWIYCR